MLTRKMTHDSTHGWVGEIFLDQESHQLKLILSKTYGDETLIFNLINEKTNTLRFPAEATLVSNNGERTRHEIEEYSYCEYYISSVSFTKSQLMKAAECVLLPNTESENSNFFTWVAKGFRIEFPNGTEYLEPHCEEARLSLGEVTFIDVPLETI